MPTRHRCLSAWRVRYYERTGDRALGRIPLAATLKPHFVGSTKYGDRDKDGFVEYERRSPDGLLHQGWRDSDDAVFHADGTPAQGPIALCEVQGYVYAAQLAGGALATLLGEVERAAHVRQRAERLQERFERAFWCEDLSSYAMALDGDKRPCRVRASNAGQACSPASPRRSCRNAWPTRSSAPRFILRLGRANGGGLGDPLQSYELSQRLGLAPRQRADCIRTRAIRSDGASVAHLERAVRGQHVFRAAPDAGTVLRLFRESPAKVRSSTPSPAPRRLGRQPPCFCFFRRAWDWRSMRHECANLLKPVRSCRPR